MRIFIGIALPPEVVERLGALVDRLRTGSEGLRWAKPESWHVTLQFLGATEAERYGCVVERLRELRHGPVALELGTVDVFDRAGVLFAEVKTTPGLVRLQEMVATATGRCGVEAESRPYHPHITLARGRSRSDARVLRELKERARWRGGERFVATEFLLYESVAAPGGSEYRVRERFELGVGGAG